MGYKVQDQGRNQVSLLLWSISSSSLKHAARSVQDDAHSLLFRCPFFCAGRIYQSTGLYLNKQNNCAITQHPNEE